MSRHSSRNHSLTIVDGDILAVIREEQTTSLASNVDDNADISSSKSKSPPEENQLCPNCNREQIEALLLEKETQLRHEFDDILKAQMNNMARRFDLILQNEQTRACFMLREAHRERSEKIQALKMQLECKNLSALMYVLCSERRKCKVEKLKIIEEYTQYIRTLQDILTEGQTLILHLSRGYKTAARVEHEWREKMKSIIQEFQEYVYHFAGGPKETNQFIFNVPDLLKTKASILDDPDEDPCTCEDDMFSTEGEDECGDLPEHRGDTVQEKTWWKLLESDCKPFVMFGDMEDFHPNERRRVVATAKAVATKTAPAKWKEYVFNDMFVKSDCPNMDAIKDEYPRQMPMDRWECEASQAHRRDSESAVSSRRSSRRPTSNSMDLKFMGSLIKMIASTNTQPTPKTHLLAAKDSMEIVSTTRLREKRNTKNVRVQNFKPAGLCAEDWLAEDRSTVEEPFKENRTSLNKTGESDEVILNDLGSMHHDSLHVINVVASKDEGHSINYEKICPMEKCQRMQVDSFMRTLPAYMRANPYTLFEQSYANYETCSPEQLKVIRERIEASKQSHKDNSLVTLSNTDLVLNGMSKAVQTTDELPPCTCKDFNPSSHSDTGRVYKVEDLIPMKLTMDEITKDCFYNHRIQFNRFKVIGEEKADSPQNEKRVKKDKDDKKYFKQQRVEELTKILRQHPSMVDLFQPNAR